MRCPKCGNEVPDKFKFCPECGTAISRDSAVEAERSIGDLRTMGSASGGAEASVGDMRTMGRAADDGGVDISVGEIQTMKATAGGEAKRDDAAVIAGRYELQEEIGRGGFAVVWKGLDRKLGRIVAIKRLLNEGQGMGGQMLLRFRREAQAIAQLNHRNIVAVYDHDRDEEGDYIVMEYVGGGTLRGYKKAKGGKLGVSEAVELVRGIAQGLGYAHRKNLVHRDIKPGNILLEKEGEVVIPKIVDFGLARVGVDSDISVSGYGMGTPYYMSPEQRRDAKNVNHTADIYALGKVLYELVSGEVPDNVDPEKIPAVPHLAEVIFKSIKTNPEERYFSAEELITALEKVVGGAVRNKVVGGENSCPACGAMNEVDVKFCESCGAGLTRVCPECGKENSVHKRYCGSCGTDVEGFLKWLETAERMERFSGEKRWSRVVKEWELLPKDVKLMREKGKALRARVEGLHKEAEKALKRLEDLKAEIKKAGAAGAWRKQEKALVKYTGLDPHDEEAVRMLEEIRAKVDDEDYLECKRRARELEKRGNFGDAMALYLDYKGRHAEGRHIKEANEEVSRLERIQEIKEQLAKGIRRGDFDDALGEIEKMAGEGVAEEYIESVREDIEKEREEFDAAVEVARGMVKERRLQDAVGRWKEILNRWPDADELKKEAVQVIAVEEKVKGLVNEGRKCLEAGKFSNALAFLKEAKKLSPLDNEIAKLLIDIRRAKRECILGIVVIVIELVGLWTWIRYEANADNRRLLREASELGQSGRYIEAIERLKRVESIPWLLINKPEVPLVWLEAMKRQCNDALLRARMAKDKRDWASVLAAVEEALKLDAGNAEAQALKVAAEEQLTRQQEEDRLSVERQRRQENEIKKKREIEQHEKEQQSRKVEINSLLAQRPQARREMIALIQSRGINNMAILNAMNKIPMEAFCPEDIVESVYTDRPIPIGFDETISQPYITALMIDELGVKAGMKVLEIKTASGYQTAILYEMGCEVYTIESDIMLADIVEKSFALMNMNDIHFLKGGDIHRGWPEKAPFDRIIATAAYKDVPWAIVEQLVDKGSFILPLGAGDAQQLVVLVKEGKKIKKKELCPVRFSMMPGE